MPAKRRGSAMVEFVLVGIPALFLTISVFEVSMIMWQYHTLAEGVAQATRYAAAHGQECSTNGNTCATSIGAVATVLHQQAIGLDTAKVNVTFVSPNGTNGPYTLADCISPGAINTTTFPPANSGGAPGSLITISVTYAIPNPLFIFWTGSAPMSAHTYTLGATSTQEILF
jgi:Flp pilus assembly protein TadG